MPAAGSARTTVTIDEAIASVVKSLPVERQQEVLDFAQFLSLREELRDWQQSGLQHFAKCYGPNEPDYGEPMR